jgi:ADP-ribosylglycohydrolase
MMEKNHPEGIKGAHDTIACITGGIAEAFYKNVPEYIAQNVLERLPDNLINLLETFSLKYRKI